MPQTSGFFGDIHYSGGAMKIAQILKETLTLILAGGQGERLYPLTKDRAKPAVPFGGQYRIIDFTLSNCANSGLERIYVLTQYKSHSLDRHLRLGWNIFSSSFEQFVDSIPPQLRTGSSWYLGTADAVFQNIDILRSHQPRRVLILSGDHIYKMDYSEMIENHIRSGAALTVAAVESDLKTAKRMGVLEISHDDRITGFQEKPDYPKTIPNRPDYAWINMGVYLFETDTLIDSICSDSTLQTKHDFGHDIIPSLVPSGKVFAYPFHDENRKEVKYWRDIGTLDSYYETSMDLVRVDPLFNLYDSAFPIHSYTPPRPPAKMIFAGGEEGRVGVALDSLICNGCVVSGGRVERSILSPDVRINSYAIVEDSILFNGVKIGRYAKVRRAIIDKEVIVPTDTCIGYDLEQDSKRFIVTDSGVVVIPKGAFTEEGAASIKAEAAGKLRFDLARVP
jgi:glucose-1-phosphate adenylyltransferase